MPTVVRDLPTFLDLLRDRGELVEVEAPANPRLEIPEVHRRVVAANGPALLFRNPTGASFPVVTNLFGTKGRVELAFGHDPQRIIQRLVDLATSAEPPGLGTLWRNRDLLRWVRAVGTRRVSRGPVLEVVDSPPGLERLPLLHCWERDGGAFVTLPLVYTEHPERGGHNLGMYRIQRFDDRTMGFHTQIGKGAGFHLQVAEARGQALPVTVFLGGPPALVLSAIAPLPENVPELLLAGLLQGERLARVPSPVGPHPLVANAEFAIIGEVRPGERRPEGPFGDHYGYYSLQHDYPVFHVKALAHRRKAILPATVVGKPRQEDFYIGDFLQDLLSPLFPVVMPAVKQLWSYGETGYHSLAGAVVRDRYARESLGSAFRILGEGQLSLTKFLLLTDHDVDLRDFHATLEAILARFKPETDLYVFSNLSMDTLDYTGPAVNEGSKGVLAGVGSPVRELPRAVPSGLPTPVRDARVWCGGCLVLAVPPYAEAPGLPADLLPLLPKWPLIVFVDDAEEATRTPSRFLWTVFTRFEPAADITTTQRIHRNHIVRELPVVIDARKKPTYPEELFCDPQTAALVDRRWKEYFPQGRVEMGDSDRAHLDV